MLQLTYTARVRLVEPPSLSPPESMGRIDLFTSVVPAAHKDVINDSLLSMFRCHPAATTRTRSLLLQGCRRDIHRCDDSVEYSDCRSKEMGIHHPNKTCAQLRVDNNYPTERTDWPEPACDLLGSCCFYFSPPFGNINRACQNAVPSGTCEKDAVINGRQINSFHFLSYQASTCPDGGAKDQDSSCAGIIGYNNCNCKLCTSGPRMARTSAWL